MNPKLLNTELYVKPRLTTKSVPVRVTVKVLICVLVPKS